MVRQSGMEQVVFVVLVDVFWQGRAGTDQRHVAVDDVEELKSERESNIVNNIASTMWTRKRGDGGPYTGVDDGEFGFGFSVFNTHAQGSELGWNMPVPKVPSP